MTTIEWTQRPGTKGETWNPIRARDRATGKVGWFCEHVTEGCRNCYAEAMNGWRGNGFKYRAQDRDKLEIFLDEAVLAKPLHWRAPRTVFPCSMTDLYADFVTDAMLDKIKAVEALCPQHTFIELTKRPERMRQYHLDWPCLDPNPVAELAEQIYPGPAVDVPDNIHDFPLGNVWLGVSCHDQASADQAVRLLLDTPAARRFLSCEPLLGPVDLSRMGLWLCKYWKSKDSLTHAPWCPEDPDKWWWQPQALLGPGQKVIDWVIAGGESGPNARPAHPDWFRQVRDQCAAAGVPFFFKQWGEWRANEAAGGDMMQRLGKKAAGRLLDGQEHNAFPEIAP